MHNTLTRVTLTLGLLLIVPRGAAAQPDCQITQTRTVRYDTVSRGTPLGNSTCRFSARVVDRTIRTCPGTAALVLGLKDDSYNVDRLTPAGNAVCAQYTPPYTAWCHGGNPPDVTTPSDLTASILPGRQVALTWRDNSPNCGCQGMYCPPSPLPAWEWFDVWRRTNIVSYELIGSVGGSATSYLDPGAPPGQQAFYVVNARHTSYSFAATTAEAAATTVNPPAPPAAPCCLTVNAGQDVVTIEWNDVSTNETGFRIERSTAGGAWTVVATLSANVTHTSDATVEPGTAYHYRVVAFNSAGASASSEASVITP